MPSSHCYRLSLKSLLLWVCYVCIGLMASVKPGSPAADTAVLSSTSSIWLVLGVFYYSAACALAGGLVEQAQQLSSTRPAVDLPLRISLDLAVGWRLATAVVLVGGLLLRIALTQEWLTHPSSQHQALYNGLHMRVVPDAVLLLGVLAALYFNTHASTGSGGWRSRPLLRNLWLLMCLAIAVAALTEFQHITYLVYKAIAGIEQYHKPEFRRPGAYIDPQVTGFWHFWLACGGLLSLVAGAAMWCKAIGNSSRPLFYGAIGTVLIAASAAYGIWFFTVGGPTLAPDFGEAGLQSRWWHWLEGDVLVVLFIPLAAYRMSQTGKFLETAIGGKAALAFPLGVPVIVLAAAGCVVGALDTIAVYFDNSVYAQSFAKHLWWLLSDLNIYPYAAMTLVLLRLLWLVFRGNELQVPVPVIDGRNFVWNCLMLAVLIPLAIPTIAAFSFSMWLSPWLSW